MLFAAVHESGCGATQTSGDVRSRAAVEGIGDIKRALIRSVPAIRVGHPLNDAFATCDKNQC
jgi:hypothetical protein